VVKPERKWMTNDDTPYANGYLKWEKESDDLLCHMFDEGTNLQVIAAELGRSEVAIKRRLRRLEKNIIIPICVILLSYSYCFLHHR
jgi:hypothetical protein